MRHRMYMNDCWAFTPSYEASEFDVSTAYKEVRIPHTVVETPFNCFSEDTYQMVCAYKTMLHVPSTWEGKHLHLTFEGAAHEATVYIDGKEVGYHLGGYTAFTVDLTHHVTLGADHDIRLVLDTRETLNTPPFGYVVDYMTYGGLYRDVYLDVLPPLHIADVFVWTENVLSPTQEMRVQVKVNDQTQALEVQQTLTYEGEEVYHAQKQPLTKEECHSLKAMHLWNLDSPHLYTLVTTLFSHGQVVDQVHTRFGFREVHFDAKGFSLNGRRLKLRGMNRHQSYPYVGYAMPKRPQVLDADILKHELSLNAVRTSHYPQSQHFINRCDEIGLLVFTEIPGWQHIGDDKWQATLIQHLKEMVLQYRNHPSIILWGVRVNESLDYDDLYQKTNEMARSLDPSRQTGGVRYLKKSNLFEDVYTYNDFSHNGKTPGLAPLKTVTSQPDKAYLVTEYNGHMFPTKTFDTASHQQEHALRHARVLSDLYLQEGGSGGFGWCMFDYNTHKDFGSGDRICHHGVMDMYRNPKLAASVYQSQGDEALVLDISSDMGIGDYPAGSIGEVYAFTNADQVDLYKNDVLIKSYVCGQGTTHGMPHPPVLLDDFIGDEMMHGEGFTRKRSDDIKKILMAAARYGENDIPLKIKLKALKLMVLNGFKPQEGVRLYGKYIGNWGAQTTTYRFDAIKSGQVVKRVIKAPLTGVALEVKTDTYALYEEASYDVASLRIRAIDQNGNVLRYLQEPVLLEFSGVIEGIGPRLVSLKGGMAGTYVKSMGKKGKGQVTISLVSHPSVKKVVVDLTCDVKQ